MTVTCRYHTLEEYLTSTTLTVDGQLDDGWGALFPVKGRELEATVLFSDISSFSARTLDLTPAETLAFVNNFFAWISAEALQQSRGIIDKYIGDEMMIVFAREFGSADPFAEALQAARWMAENDAHSFCPHIGLASGPVIVGYVGTPLKYSCSVFGAPVALAARCATVAPDFGADDSRLWSSSIVFPAREWQDRDLSQLFPPVRVEQPDGTIGDVPHSWELRPERIVELKNMPDTPIREIVNFSVHLSSFPPEDRAREGLAGLREAGRYWPKPADS